MLSCFSIKSDYAKTEICKQRQRDFQFGDWLQIWYFGQHNFASIISSNRIAISGSLLIWYGSNLEFKYVYQFSICMSADQIFQWNDATPSSILMKIFWVNIFDECEHTSYSSTIKTKITKCYYFLFFSYDEIAQCLPHPKWGPDIKGLNMEIIINNDLVWISFSIWYIILDPLMFSSWATNPGFVIMTVSSQDVGRDWNLTIHPDYPGFNGRPISNKKEVGMLHYLIETE